MWLADRHSDQELYTAAKHCAKIHLAQLHQTEEFLNLPFCLLLDIIKGNIMPRHAAIYHNPISYKNLFCVTIHTKSLSAILCLFYTCICFLLLSHALVYRNFQNPE